MNRTDLIILGHNPWQCDGSQHWIQECSHGVHVVILCMEWLSVESMVCVSPPNVTGLLPTEAGMICSRVLTISMDK